MSIVRIKDNHSIRVSLKYVSALEKPAKGGIGYEYLYTLQNGDALYVSPQGHDEIKALRPQAGEPFLLSKHVQNGSVLWGVERIETEPDKSAPGPKPMARAIAAASVPIPPSLTTRESQRIFTQLVATIQAAQAAEEFAKSINFPVKFAAEDLRAMAISGFIEQSRRAA
jgi:hypothetical protein